MYTITLQDAPRDITDRAQRDAGQRFGKALERALGGPDAVLAAYRAWQAAEETAEAEMAPENLALAKRWMAAAARARNDGLRKSGKRKRGLKSDWRDSGCRIGKTLYRSNRVCVTFCNPV